jgi:predicted CoA-binding protein
MPTAEDALDHVDTILVVDWPSRDVPDTLARAGFLVVVHGGPGPEDYSAYEVEHGAVVVRPLRAAPDHGDLVYTHRPIAELPGIVSTAQAIGARVVWHQSGRASTGAKDPTGCWMPEDESRQARQIVESAGLSYFDQPYIADVVRERQR